MQKLVPQHGLKLLYFSDIPRLAMEFLGPQSPRFRIKSSLR